MKTVQVNARLPKCLVDRLDEALNPENGQLRKDGVRNRSAALERGVRQVLDDIEDEPAS